MDLGSECSTLELVEDNEAAQNTIHHAGYDKIKNKLAGDRESKDNGSCTNDDPTQRSDADQTDESNAFTADNHVKGTSGSVQPMLSPLVAVKSPCASSSPTTKGYGLKKWRRIKRDFVKDATVTMESGKIVKRGLTASANPDPSKPQHRASPEINQSSGSPNESMNMLKNAGLAPGFKMHSPNSDSIFAVGAAFASATDSENSEDRSSKSSTAASMPKVRHDLPSVLGYIHEKHQMNLSGNTVGNSSQQVQRGRGRAESSKKGEGVVLKAARRSEELGSNSRRKTLIPVWNPTQEAPTLTLEGSNFSDK